MVLERGYSVHVLIFLWQGLPFINARNMQKKSPRASPQPQRSHGNRNQPGPSYFQPARYDEEPAYHVNKDKSPEMFDIKMEKIEISGKSVHDNDSVDNSRTVKDERNITGERRFGGRQYESFDVNEYDAVEDMSDLTGHYPGGDKAGSLQQDNVTGENDDDDIDDKKDEEFRLYLESVKDPKIEGDVSEDVPLTNKFKVRFID